MIKIPLVSGRNKAVATSIGDYTYVFETQWNNRLELYTMDIYQEGVLVLAGIMIVAGINIIEGLTGIALPNIYCVNPIEAFEEINFDGLTDEGFVVTDTTDLITSDEEYIEILRE